MALLNAPRLSYLEEKPQPSADASCSSPSSDENRPSAATAAGLRPSDAGEERIKSGRELCVTGCAILWRGRSLLDRAVELFTPFSHSSLVVRMDEYLGTKDRVTCIEALPGGLQPTLFSERARGFTGEIALFVPDGLTPERQSAIRAFALTECLKGKGYDYLGFLANILGRPREHRSSYFCSEFYGMALDKNGIARKGCQAASCSSLSSDEARAIQALPGSRECGRGADKIMYRNKLAPRPGDIPDWWPGSLYRLTGPFIASLF